MVNNPSHRVLYVLSISQQIQYIRCYIGGLSTSSYTTRMSSIPTHLPSNLKDEFLSIANLSLPIIDFII